jgi:ABC-type molybdate transport system ATPase subunit
VKKLEDPVPISVHRGAVDFMVEGRRQRVLNDINLVSLFGSSGCGKSTLSKMMAGLVALSEGTISVAGIAPQEAANARLIGRTFHDATLLPWKTDQPTQRAARSSSNKATLYVVDPSAMLDMVMRHNVLVMVTGRTAELVRAP